MRHFKATLVKSPTLESSLIRLEDSVGQMRFHCPLGDFEVAYIQPQRNLDGLIEAKSWSTFKNVSSVTGFATFSLKAVSRVLVVHTEGAHRRDFDYGDSTKDAQCNGHVRITGADD